MDFVDKAAPVTKREFHGALALVWGFIMLTLSESVLRGPRSPIRSVANVIYLAISLLMVINYAVASRRGNMSRTWAVVAVVLVAAALAVGAAVYFFTRGPSN